MFYFYKGSTRIKISGNQSDQTTSAEFIEKRRLALERFLKRIALHPILRNDKNFCEFLEQGIYSFFIALLYIKLLYIYIYIL